MSLRTIAARTARDPIRTRSVWALGGIFAILFGLLAHFHPTRDAAAATVFSEVIFVFVPIVALSIGYQTIVKPRQNGSLRVILSYPHTRSELVVGATVGRGLVAAAAVSVGFLSAGLIYLLKGWTPDLTILLTAWGLALAVAATFIGLSVGVSAAVQTTKRAALACFGVFFLFFGFWNQIPVLIRYALNGFSFPRGPAPEWVDAFGYLNPLNAYRTLSESLLLPANATVRDATTSFYTTDWFATLVLLGWLVIPLIAGLWRFTRSDL